MRPGACLARARTTARVQAYEDTQSTTKTTQKLHHVRATCDARHRRTVCPHDAHPRVRTACVVRAPSRALARSRASERIGSSPAARPSCPTFVSSHPSSHCAHRHRRRHRRNRARFSMPCPNIYCVQFADRRCASRRDSRAGNTRFVRDAWYSGRTRRRAARGVGMCRVRCVASARA